MVPFLLFIRGLHIALTVRYGVWWSFLGRLPFHTYIAAAQKSTYDMLQYIDQLIGNGNGGLDLLSRLVITSVLTVTAGSSIC